ncbi:hypothetical protein WK54_15270 [Burkholderia ubonensis]|nr:hypothetical protein WK54_15270 [Burkholderia ubonensis]
MGQQGQRDVAIPAMPSAHLVLIKPAFAFGRLEAGFDFPSATRDVGQGLPCRLAARRVHDAIRMFAFLIKAAPHQQVMPEAALFGGNLQTPQWG